jgi:Lar family restriction alleviation protein
MSEELKPCPFCGGVPFVATVEHSEESRPNGYRFHGQIICRNCQSSAGTTGFDLTYDIATRKAMDAWNRRVLA